MKTRISFLCLMCLFAGVGIGIFLPFNQSEFEDEISLDESSVHRNRKSKNKSTEIDGERSYRGVRKRHTKQRSSDWENSLASSNSVTVPVSLLQELGTLSRSAGLQHSIFDKNDSTQRLLRITDVEKATIQAKWTATREQIRKSEVAKAKIKYLENGAAKIDLPENSASMQECAENFEFSLVQLMGENRGRAFAALKNTEKRISSLGAKRSYNIAFEPIPNERWRYRIDVEINGQRRVWVTETLPNELSHLSEEFTIPTRANVTDVKTEEAEE